MTEPAGHGAPPWLRSLTGWPAAWILLALFALLATSSAVRKSATFDEVAHLTAGYSYWAYDDYRLHPENGNLPQRLVALPAVLGRDRFPALDQPAWRGSRVYEMAQQFLFGLGNDADSLVLEGRLTMIVVGILGGLLVYGIGRRLYGAVGGTISLAAYAFDPHILAHARLMTSDLLTALLFLGSVWALWGLLERFTAGRLALSALAVTGLFLSKMSAVLILPMAAMMVALRVWRGAAWEIRLPGLRRDVTARGGQLLAAGAALLAHVAVAWVLVWAFYGFHYDAFRAEPSGPGQFEAGADNLLGERGAMGTAVAFAQEHRLLPQAYLYGFSFAVDQSQRRLAFAAGRRGEDGWWWFFPYAFAVKTSEALLLLLAVAALAAVSGGEIRARLYRTAPLWVLLGVYSAFAVRSSLNIGHRHVLPLYPALFLLAGAAGTWLVARQRRRSLVAGGAVVAVMVTGVLAWPDYLAYFNRLSGGKMHGYQHLVDSSLDWGQDLPALRRWLEKEGLDAPGGTPVYFSYFGTSSPDHHGIRALRLPGYFDLGRRRTLVPLRGGVYCISASMLQVYGSPASAPWDAEAEAGYRAFLARLPPDVRLATRPMPYVDPAMEMFDHLRTAKLVDYLRQREPDANIAGTILVYRLSDQDVEEALYRKIA